MTPQQRIFLSYLDMALDHLVLLDMTHVDGLEGIPGLWHQLRCEERVDLPCRRSLCQPIGGEKGRQGEEAAENCYLSIQLLCHRGHLHVASCDCDIPPNGRSLRASVENQE